MNGIFLSTVIAVAIAGVACAQESPFSCNRTALSPAARKRHFDELSPILVAKSRAIHELADGYEIEFPSDAETVAVITEWTKGEQLCCPFFDIDLRLDREKSGVHLRLTGREGVKEFIRMEFARVFAKADG
jgi:hypothetical protein